MLLITCAAILATVPCVEGSAVEVSADGLQSVTIDKAAGTAMSMSGSSAVPYPTVPDWSNTLRRQVGGLQVADMNGDGWNDIVVGCYISNSFPPYDDWENMIYYNNGGTIESSPSWVSADEVSTGDIQVADFNGDGHLDIFAANGGFAMAPSVIYYGSATGPDPTPDWSSAEPMLAWNNYALPVDIDGDGDMDVVTANQGNSPDDAFRPMYLFRNDGGTLGTVPVWESAESSIQNFLAAGDIDNDGNVDIAVSKWVNWESGIYGSNGTMLDTTPWWTTGDDGDDKGAAVADLDGDGALDFMLGHDPTQRFEYAGGTMMTNLWTATGPYFGHSDLRIVDVDHDGDLDVAETHFSNGQVYIFLNTDGVLSAAPDWVYDSSTVGTAIAFGDLNNDGWTDLVVGNSGDVSVKVFFAVPVIVAGDVNGDGTVNFDDLLAMLASWGPCPGCAEDIDGNGFVEFSDLLVVLSNWS